MDDVRRRAERGHRSTRTRVTDPGVERGRGAGNGGRGAPAGRRTGAGAGAGFRRLRLVVPLPISRRAPAERYGVRPLLRRTGDPGRGVAQRTARAGVRQHVRRSRGGRERRPEGGQRTDDPLPVVACRARRPAPPAPLAHQGGGASAATLAARDAVGPDAGLVAAGSRGGSVARHSPRAHRAGPSAGADSPPEPRAALWGRRRNS